MKTILASVLFAAFSASFFAQAAPKKMVAVKPQPLGTFVRSGIVTGGVAGDAFSILRVQKTAGSEGSERVSILYGNGDGQPLKKATGYFHISVDEKRARVSIDLAQVQKTAVDESDLAKLFSGSKLVSSAEITMDPIDLSTNILLHLKQSAEVKAQIQETKGTSALVVELRPTTVKE